MKKILMKTAILLLLVSGCSDKSQEKIEYDTEIVKEGDNKIQFIESSFDGDDLLGFVLTQETKETVGIHFPNEAYEVINRKIVVSNYSGETSYYIAEGKKGRRVFQQLIEKYSIDTIDIETGEVNEFIDLKKILDDLQMLNHSPSNTSFQKIDDQLMFQMYITPRIHEGADLLLYDDKILEDSYLNLETRKFEDGVRRNGFRPSDKGYQVRNQFISGTNISDLNGIGSLEIHHTEGISESYYSIGILAKELPENNDKLYRLFPNLLDYRNSNSRIYMNLYLEKDIIEILGYFTESGKELTYEGAEFYITPKPEIDKEFSSYSEYLEKVESFSNEE